MRDFLLNSTDVLCRWFTLHAKYTGKTCGCPFKKKKNTICTAVLCFTFSHHTQLNLLLHHHGLFVLRNEEGAVECAAVRPHVIESDVVQVNSSDLDVAGQGSLPLQPASEILMDDVSSGVVITENLRKYIVD